MSDEQTSAILLSMHKAGSSIADLILADFYSERGLEIDRIALQVPGSELSEPEIFMSYQEKMKLRNVYYGVARGPYVSDLPIVMKLDALVQVRDPRDCLTSAYFSYKASHRPPTDPKKLEAFNARRERLQNMTIDEYAIKQSGAYANRMNILKDIVDNHDNSIVLKYEDMVLHTNRWLTQISNFVGQPVTGELRQKLGQKIDFSVDGEDPTRHKRQVTPGDHKRKLAPETIAKMNEKLKDQLAFFGYEE